MFKGKNIFLCFILFLTVFVVYSSSLTHGFVWDDKFIVADNPLLRAPLLSFQVFKQDIINSSFTYTVYYRPIQILSYALDYRIWGINPLGYHFSNIFIHFLNSVLAFFLFLGLSQKKGVSFFASLLFLIHPSFLGIVSYVSGRADLLFVFFGILFLLAQIKFRTSGKVRFLVEGAVFLFFSLLSKEMGIVFVFLFLLIDLFFLTKRYGFAKICHIVNLLLVISYSALYVFMTFERLAFTSYVGFTDKFLAFLKVFVESVKICVFPVDFSFRESLTNIESSSFLYLVFFTIFFLAVLAFLRNGRKLILYSVLFFLISLSPIFFILKPRGVFSEHWVYLSSLGVFFFLGLIIEKIYSSRKIILKLLACMIMLFCFIFYSKLAMTRNAYWSDDISLSNHVKANSHNDSSASNFKAMKLYENGMIQEALDISQNQDVTPLSLYLNGRIKIASGDVTGARKDFEKSAKLKSDYDNAYIGLSLVALSEKNTKDGLKYLDKVIKINPHHPEALLLLVMSYFSIGDSENALKCAIRAHERDPYGYETLLNLGQAYIKIGFFKESAKTYLKVINIYPEMPKSYYELSQIFLINGDKKWALFWIEKCLTVDPSYVPALEKFNELKKHNSIKP